MTLTQMAGALLLVDADTTGSGIVLADKILAKLDRDPTRHQLKVAYPVLGDEGAIRLFAGLEARRRSLQTLLLANQQFTDVGLRAALHYACLVGDVHELDLGNNPITLDTCLDDILYLIQKAGVERFRFDQCQLSEAALPPLLASLTSLHLEELNINNCPLPSIQPMLSSYLSHASVKRCYFRDTNLAFRDMLTVVGAIERHNFSVVDLSIFESFSDLEPPLHEWELLQRIDGVLDRNRQILARVQLSAARVVAPARILLNAMPPRSPVLGGNSANKARVTLLDLPVELRLHIARFSTGDAHVLTDVQWSHVFAFASDMRTLGSLPPYTNVNQGTRLSGWCKTVGCSVFEGLRE